MVSAARAWAELLKRTFEIEVWVRPDQAVARSLGVTQGAVSKRLKASLERLRRLLPGSIFDQLEDGS